MQYGKIEITTEQRQVTPNSWRMYITDARWDGPIPARLDYSLVHFCTPDADLTDNDSITIGPLRVRVIGSNPCYYSLLVVPESRWAWWYRLRHRVAWRAEWIAARIIMTCAVWDLARWDIAKEPQWSDIHLVRWIQNALPARKDRHDPCR